MSTSGEHCTDDLKIPFKWNFSYRLESETSPLRRFRFMKNCLTVRRRCCDRTRVNLKGDVKWNLVVSIFVVIFGILVSWFTDFTSNNFQRLNFNELFFSFFFIFISFSFHGLWCYFSGSHGSRVSSTHRVFRFQLKKDRLGWVEELKPVELQFMRLFFTQHRRVAKMWKELRLNLLLSFSQRREIPEKPEKILILFSLCWCRMRWVECSPHLLIPFVDTESEELKRKVTTS